ncbi:iron-containing redox enzyme family protein [Streptomyces durbertensis]|uniref:iron-containing redox enzyme family protein n=1 Tax=Streptomyces durbertensis TaxID=2448886 RepID=UPI002B1FBED0|nr:iron-containing redox enzyme family protein [Streptomyces durbertensis]
MSTAVAGATPHHTDPPLPHARGELSEAVITALREPGSPLPSPAAVAEQDPFGEDLQLLLYVLYELHYRGFRSVDADAEWDPGLLAVRAAADARFLAALREGTGDADGGGDGDVAAAVEELLVEPVGHDPDSVSHHLRRSSELWQLTEYAALRSLYHLKEADPHLWVVPRLWGRAKAAMVAVEYDEFGAGRAEDVHARLFADLMTDLGLDARYGRYLDHAPAAALATVNMMSLFGLRRSLRGALAGHFAAVEITSSPGSARLAEALRAAGAGPAAQRFYDEHVEADAVHEQVVRHEVLDGLLEEEPHLAPDVVFGIRATGFVEARFAAHVLPAWRAGRSALRAPLDASPPR